MTTPCKNMRVDQLKAALAERSLDTTGLKAVLVARLEGAMGEDVVTGDAVVEAAEDAVVEAETGTDEVVEAADAVVAEEPEAAVETPEAAVETPEAAVETTEVEEAKSGLVKIGGSEEDLLEAKKKRAERFGEKLTLTDDDKRRARAKRFGCDYVPVGGAKKQKTAGGSPAAAAKPKPAGARPTTSPEQSAKLQARLKRFGGIPSAASSPATSPAAKSPASKTAKVNGMSDAEQKKRDARAARFANFPDGQPPAVTAVLADEPADAMTDAAPEAEAEAEAVVVEEMAAEPEAAALEEVVVAEVAA